MKNDVWTVIGACVANESAGSFVHFNTVIGFKHQATGGNLHSHGISAGTTPKSNHQQGILSQYIHVCIFCILKFTSITIKIFDV